MAGDLDKDVVIIIPAYHEAGRIGQTILGIRKHTDIPIVVINDGSKDNTAAEAEEAGATVIALPFNLGYGGALQTGFKYALRKGYTLVVQMDADGQHDPAYILPLLEDVRSDKVDVAIGSRFLGRGDYRTTIFKRTGMVFLSVIASAITRQKITDPTSGFQALNKKAMEFYATEVYPMDFPDADVLVMLYRKGIRFWEVPVRMNQSTKGKTMHSGIVPLYYLFKMVLSIFVTLLRKT